MHVVMDVSTIVVSCSRDPDAARHVVFALREVGWRGAIEIVRPSSHLRRMDASAVLLAGGLDIAPWRWSGRETVDGTGPIDPERDEVELALAESAWQRGLPIFGICRGAQLLAVARGGTLHADIPMVSGVLPDAHQYGDAESGCVRHDVLVRARSRLHSILGETRVTVNSRHHQAVCDPGDGLVAVAHEPDTAMPEGSLIEAIESDDPERWVVGVQWHPENLVRRSDHAGIAARRLFAHFVLAALEKDRLADRGDLPAILGQVALGPM